MTFKTKEPSSGNLMARTGILSIHSKLYLSLIYNGNAHIFLDMNNTDGIHIRRHHERYPVYKRR